MGLLEVITARQLDEYKMAHERLKALRTSQPALYSPALYDFFGEWITYYQEKLDQRHDREYIEHQLQNRIHEMVQKYGDETRFEQIEVRTESPLDIMGFIFYFNEVKNLWMTSDISWQQQNITRIADLYDKISSSLDLNWLRWYFLIAVYRILIPMLPEDHKQRVITSIDSLSEQIASPEVLILKDHLLSVFNINQDPIDIAERLSRSIALLNEKNPKPRGSIRVYNSAGMLYSVHMNDYDQGRAYSQMTLALAKEYHDVNMVDNSYGLLILCASAEEKLSVYQEAISYFKEHHEPYYQSQRMAMLAQHCITMNRFDQAAYWYEEVLSLGLIEYYARGRLLSNELSLSTAYAFNDKYEHAIDLLDTWLETDETTKINQNPIVPMNLARYLSRVGRTNDAILLLDRTIEIVRDSPYLIGINESVLLAKAYLLKDLGRNEDSLAILEPLFEQMSEEEGSFFISTYLASILAIMHIYYIQREYSKVDEYLQVLLDLDKNGRVPDSFKADVRVWQAKLLQSRQTMRDLVKARDIIEDVIVHEPWDLDARLELVNLVLEEAQFFDDHQRIEEVGQLIREILEIALKKHEFTVYLRSKILQSRILIIQGVLDEAETLLSDTRAEAQRLGLNFLKTIIDDEIRLLRNRMQDYQNLINQNVDLSRRIKEARISSYIQKALETTRNS